MSEETEVLPISEVLGLIVERYVDRPDDFVLSLGHHSKPVSRFNLPEFCAYMAISMREFRQWYSELKSSKNSKGSE